jgi:hypothetical protein
MDTDLQVMKKEVKDVVHTWLHAQLKTFWHQEAHGLK